MMFPFDYCQRSDEEDGKWEFARHKALLAEGGNKTTRTEVDQLTHMTVSTLRFPQIESISFGGYRTYAAATAVIITP
jgi:hypothetical protein